MSKIKDNIIKIFNQIFRKNSVPMITIDTRQNYEVKQYKEDGKFESNIRISPLENKDWQEKTKHHTYKDKIKLITDNYSKKLQNFDRKTIDNALDFLQRRNQNHGNSDNDIELNLETKKIFELMQKYEQSIKKVFVDNNINITHITSIAPEKFNPVCNLTIDPRSHEPIFEFSEEWISDTEIDISDSSQVTNIEKINDVTSLLDHYTILCDTQSQGIGVKVRQCKTRDEELQFIREKIKDGSIRNINAETRINDKDLSTNVER